MKKSGWYDEDGFHLVMVMILSVRRLKLVQLTMISQTGNIIESKFPRRNINLKYTKVFLSGGNR